MLFSILLKEERIDQSVCGYGSFLMSTTRCGDRVKKKRVDLIENLQQLRRMMIDRGSEKVVGVAVGDGEPTLAVVDGKGGRD